VVEDEAVGVAEDGDVLGVLGWVVDEAADEVAGFAIGFLGVG
jgi:hypothetical protein